MSQAFPILTPQATVPARFTVVPIGPQLPQVKMLDTIQGAM